jgi:sugar (pentulose or hexulose) kinase
MHFLGIDTGTSSIRCTLVDENAAIINQCKVALQPPDNPAAGHFEQPAPIWLTALQQALQQMSADSGLTGVAAIALDGTSSTVLLTDSDCNPLSPALMYNDSRASAQVEELRQHAPTGHLTLNASSSLAKSLWLLRHNDTHQAGFIMHQADWLNSWLTGKPGESDPNNCLKLGYDSLNFCWPDWIDRVHPELKRLLPRVAASGSEIGKIASEVSAMYGIPPQAMVIRGTTDSTASVLATGISAPGDAVTTLGSTLVMKILAQSPVDSVTDGIYSHRMPSGMWLAGGASNSGGNVLLEFFTEQQITGLSAQIDPHNDSGLDYYPLSGAGERFPVNDPQLQPRLLPRPDSDVLFLQGIFEGFANIEKLAYEKLAALGTGYPKRILSAGGAAVHNPALQAIRERILGVPVVPAMQTEASYGMAILARNSYSAGFVG